MPVTRRVHARIRGRVQGVGFRYFALEAAGRLGVSGWVRNRPDGGVELEAQAAPEALESFLAEVRRGPPFSRVDSVELQEIPNLGEEGTFQIRGA